MIIEKINELLASKSFGHIKGFDASLDNQELVKTYSIFMPQDSYPIEKNTHGATVCFFFYASGYPIHTFLCRAASATKNLKNLKLSGYRYPCTDINRSSDWKWVDIP